MVHYAEHRGLEHLGLYKRSLDNDNRLVREGNLPLLHRIYVAREFHPGKIMPELRIFVTREEFPEEILRHGAEI